MVAFTILNVMASLSPYVYDHDALLDRADVTDQFMAVTRTRSLYNVDHNALY